MSNFNGLDSIDPVKALKKCKSALIAVAVATALINILYLTGSFYMLEVYDRVIPSKSIPSLVALTILAAILYTFHGGFEIVRQRMLVRIGGFVDEANSPRMFRTIVKAPLRMRIAGDGMQPLRDFDQIKSFLSSGGPAAMFDLPWMPIYVIICFMFHPAIGYISIGGAIMLAFLTYLTNRSTQSPQKRSAEAANVRSAFAQAAIRNAEVIQAMGLRGRMTELWESRNRVFRELNQTSSDISSGYMTLSKIFRIALQSGTLATGAILVINGDASSGIIIAGSILTSRALAPVEMAIANWRGLVAAQQSLQRLNTLFSAMPEADLPLPLHAPSRYLSVEGLSSGPPGGQRLVVTDITFSVGAGSAVGIIGMSASGKSSLGRAMLGLWPAFRGTVRLDGASLDQWDSDALGQYIGYLPQDVELFAGTVAQNICRFSRDMRPDSIISAAKSAGVHDLVLRLPKGYETDIGDGGTSLSAGQRQRIALARALYGNPFLVVLDEPNSNLDEEGERALVGAILGVRARGGIVIVIAHRPGVLAALDLVLMMQEGRMVAFGPKEEVLARVTRRDPPPQRIEGGKPTLPDGQADMAKNDNPRAAE